MRKIKILAAAFLVCFCPVFASAYSVAFQILQRDSSESKIREATYGIEENLFDFFFSKGIVISNSPVTVSEDSSSDENHFRKSFDEALEGGVDYFIEIIGEFDVSDSSDSTSTRLENIKCVSWKVKEVDSGKILGSGKGVPPSALKIKNVQKGISDFTVVLATEIYKAIGR